MLSAIEYIHWTMCICVGTIVRTNIRLHIISLALLKYSLLIEWRDLDRFYRRTRAKSFNENTWYDLKIVCSCVGWAKSWAKCACSFPIWVKCCDCIELERQLLYRVNLMCMYVCKQHKKIWNLFLLKKFLGCSLKQCVSLLLATSLVRLPVHIQFGWCLVLSRC